jgi:glycine/serine hydroxymethyltransferase
VTALGMKEAEMSTIAGLLVSGLKQASKPKELKRIRQQTEELAVSFQQVCT